MKDQINTIRAALELATPHYQADTERFKQALSALAELERTHYTPEDVADASAQGFRDGVASVTAGQEPVAWMHWPHGPVRLLMNKDEAELELERLNREYPVDAGERQMRPLVFGGAAPVAQQPRQCGLCGSDEAFTGTCGGGRRDPRALCYEPVAQQPQARPDFTDEWTGYLKDGETPFERFLRERKDVQSALKLYQRALEENEQLKAQQVQPSDNERAYLIGFADGKQAQAEAVPNPAVAAIEYVLEHPTDGPIEFLNCWMHGDFSALRNEWEDVPEAVFVGADPTISTAPQQAEAVPNLHVGNLPTVNQDEYPGLGAWWVQIWQGDEVFARAYGDTPREARQRAERIAAAPQQAEAVPSNPPDAAKEANTPSNCRSVHVCADCYPDYCKHEQTTGGLLPCEFCGTHDSKRIYADPSVIEAAKAHMADETVPPGYALVPVEPTDAMLDAAAKACAGRMYPADMRHGPRAQNADRYRAMIGAVLKGGTA